MRFLCLLLPAGFLAACATPGGGGLGRDEMGHRPGPRGFRTVVIDAGHGGEDTGARSSATGALEKDLALDLARRLRGELPGWRTVMVRDGDRFVDLDDRVAFANRHGGGVLVSLHGNHGPSHLAGPETFYWRVDSHGLATRIQRHLAAVAPGENGNRGLVRRRLRLTRNPEIPCVLVEYGYLSHPAEAQRLSSPAYRQAVARAVARALREQSAHGDAGTGPLPPPIDAPMSRSTDAPE